MTTTVPQRAPAPAFHWFDGKRYLWTLALFVPVLPFLGWALSEQTGHPAWFAIGPVMVFGLVPLLDWFVGNDGGNPPESLVEALQEDRFYRWVTFLYLPLMFAGLALCAHEWVEGGLGVWGVIGLVLTMGTVSGIGINTAHELGHKRESLERVLSVIALSPTFYGHFYVEHNRGHHTRVATPEDAASARLGEPFWRFFPRTVWGSLRSAVELEWSALRLRGRNPWSWRNDVLKAWALSLVLWGALVAWLGWAALPFLVLQAVVGFALLEAVNYLEHYGLKRAKNDAGRYEKVDARHSWNSDRLATNLFLLQLQRHSDHHANPTRRYQVLRSLDVSPQLPMGYNAMIVLSLVPPLWRHMMDARVVEHYGGDVELANLDPRRARRLRKRFAA